MSVPSTLRLIIAATVVSAVAVSAQPLPSGQGRVYVSITDAAGRVSAVARDVESFHVWEGGAVRTVVSATPAVEPPAIVVIVHGFATSDAVDARKALTALVTTVRTASPNARIAIIGDVKTPVLSNITADAAKIDEATRRFAVSGSNLVYFEAIVDAAKALGKEATDRRIIVSLTKSTRHDADHQTTQETLDALKKSMASVWCIDVTPDDGSSQRNMKPTTEMDGFISHAPDYSGGTLDRMFGTAALEASATRLAQTMLAQYQVTFARPERRGESELRLGVAGKPGEKVAAPGWFVK